LSQQLFYILSDIYRIIKSDYHENRHIDIHHILFVVERRQHSTYNTKIH